MTRPQDFARFAGHEAKVEMRRVIEGRRRFRGLLKGVEDGCAVLVMEGEAVKLPVEDIEKAKLLVSEGMIGGGKGRAGRERRPRD